MAAASGSMSTLPKLRIGMPISMSGSLPCDAAKGPDLETHQLLRRIARCGEGLLGPDTRRKALRRVNPSATMCSSPTGRAAERGTQVRRNAAVAAQGRA